MTEILQVGITGGIGAGKTLICEIFSHLGIPVYNADNRAKWLMANHQELKGNIIHHFGEKAYFDQDLNRRYLAEHVFNHPEKLNLLNSLVHPKVQEDYLDWVNDQNSPYCIKEAALLFETGSYKHLYKNVLVYAPTEVRISRVLRRDPFRKEEEIKQIISKQMNDQEKRDLADITIYNDDKHMVLPVVLNIHVKLIQQIPF